MPPARPESIDRADPDDAVIINTDDPSLMTPQDRLLEVASLLAAGLRRHMGRIGGASICSGQSEPVRLELPEHAGRHLSDPVVSAPETESLS